MIERTEHEKYMRRITLSSHNVEFRHESEDRQYECHLCGSKHYGRFTKMRSKRTGEAVHICEACRQALSYVTVFDTEESIDTVQ